MAYKKMSKQINKNSTTKQNDNEKEVKKSNYGNQKNPNTNKQTTQKTDEKNYDPTKKKDNKPPVPVNTQLPVLIKDNQYKNKNVNTVNLLSNKRDITSNSTKGNFNKISNYNFSTNSKKEPKSQNLNLKESSQSQHSQMIKESSKAKSVRSKSLVISDYNSANHKNLYDKILQDFDDNLSKNSIHDDLENLIDNYDYDFVRIVQDYGSFYEREVITELQKAIEANSQKNLVVKKPDLIAVSNIYNACIKSYLQLFNLHQNQYNSCVNQLTIKDVNFDSKY